MVETNRAVVLFERQYCNLFAETNLQLEAMPIRVGK